MHHHTTTNHTTMAKLFLSLSFLLLVVHGCFSRDQSCQGSFQSKNECQIGRINALEPNQRFQSEGGFTEFFDSNEQQFKCAGVEVLRHLIQPRGLLLPSYTNTPILFYVEQGNGIQGVMLPGCPETYEVSQEQFQGRKGGSFFQDKHQKINHFRQGDVVAIPTGAAHWIYNEGQEELVIVALLDSTNFANQLDQYHRRFFLAGNMQQNQQQSPVRRPFSPWGRPQQSQSQEKGSKNIFQGFDVEIIAEAFNVDRETAEALRCEDDRRGHIVMVERGLQIIRPSMEQERQQQGVRQQQGQQQVGRQQQQGQQQGGRGPSNGLEETICSMKLKTNIDDSTKADFYNPQAGRSIHLNSLKFPILEFLQLGAERGELFEHGIMAPHWIMNAHKIIYVTNGNMRVQIVNDQGVSVFNDQIQEQQLVIVPQNFAVVKQAGGQGCRWISFMTNDNAMINTLAGETSAMRALPVDVLAYSYRMSREEAQQLKYNRQETLLFGYTGRTSGGRVMDA